MTRFGRLDAEFGVALRSFLRRRTAVFFTFLFPTILVVIFGALVQTDPGSGGLFAESPAYYVPGYVAVVVLFTPLSRMSSEVARHREGNRFEKLATTPLQRSEWLAAHVAVNVAIVGLAAALILGLVVALTGAPLGDVWLLPLFLVPGIVGFCGIGTILGRVTDSRDGAVAASNTIGLPLLFLSNTFVPPSQLPGWFGPIVNLSPLTYFARGARSAMYGGGSPWFDLAVLSGFAVLAFAVAAVAIPQTD
ncbi:ABC-type multidrug transport system, permease component [Salinarchaeum sp. Harcht-Bsk1]|uniref:ABC transporter permease n=1 Tax=Salinarchaeum sp. Harcht-Bsk1 TaxID=1333523 RepID=UPI00034237BE|nr:ABC transporter permease [Salinarchaeum sp. Harcht-Bsk1]AGN02963.1 ABC-type multidrug transport system, permease component [Salinarchaeum sp. Harcht-Bsk1]